MPLQITNWEAVVPWIESFVHLPEARDLVVLALERAIVRDIRFMVVLRDAKFGEPASSAEYAFLPDSVDFGLRQKVEHVVDWVVSSVVADASWLKKLDGAGRPLKLMKLGSLERAVREADKAMLRLSAAVPKVALGEGELHFRGLEGGWKLVRLTTPAALDVESSRMQHCIGHGAYDRHLLDETRIYLSLRDPAGRPHVTMEVERRDRILRQLQGKQNRLPERHYVDVVLPYLLELGGNTGQLIALGLLRDSSGVIHDIASLPEVFEYDESLTFDMTRTTIRLPAEKLVVEGDLNIGAPPGTRIILPRTLRVKGILRLHGDFRFPDDNHVEIGSGIFDNGSVENLPQGLNLASLELKECRTGPLPARIKIGRLTIRGGDIVELPDGMEARSLTLRGIAIASLPSGLELDQLNVEDCDLLTSLPDDLRVDRLNLAGPGIRSLPAGMDIDELQLMVCKSMTSLPDDLTVHGNATIRQTPLISLGARMKVQGELFLEAMPCLAELPADLVVERLLVSRGVVSVIPEGMTAESISLFGCGVVDLPRHISLGGSLKLKETYPRNGMESLQVGGSLEIHNSKRVVVPPRSVVGGSMTLSSSDGTVRIGAETKVGGKSEIANSHSVVVGSDVDFGLQLSMHNIVSTISLSSGLKVAGSINFVRSDGISIPDDFQFSALGMATAKDVRLPRRFIVSGSVFLDGVEFLSMPEVVEIGGKLDVASCTGMVLPDGLVVGGDARFDICSDLVVGRNADFQGNATFNTTILRHGAGMQVSGNLHGWGLTHLPDGCYADSFKGTAGLKQIGAGCRFHYLLLMPSQIEKLPAGLVVVNEMDIQATRIRELPDDLVVMHRLVLNDGFKGSVLPKGVDPDNVEYVVRGDWCDPMSQSKNHLCR